MRSLILLPALALPQTALADITAAELWADWQTAAAAQGATVNAENVTETGDGLKITGIRSEYSDETAGAIFVITTPEVVMSNKLNGSVVLRIPQGQQVEITETDISPDRLVLGLDSSSLTITASGTSAETDYEWNAPELAITLLEAESETAPGDLEFSFVLTDLEGELSGYDGQVNGPIEALFKAAETRWTVGMTDPELGQLFRTDARQDNVLIEIETAGLDAEGLPEDDGKIEFSFASASGNATNSRDGQVISETEHGEASVELNMTATRASYEAGAQDLEVKLDDSSLPIRPLEVSLDKFSLNLDAPIAEADAAQDFDLSVNVSELALSDDTWAAFDPQAALPRGPLALELELDGEALVGQAAKVPGLPAEATPGFAPTKLNVEALELKMAGAEAQANGAFTMPTPAEMAAGNAPPQPVGTLDVTLNGIPELLEKLSQSGLVPAQQLMGAQMMLGMFANQQADGSMTTQVESKPDGSLFVNGNRLR